MKKPTYVKKLNAKKILIADDNRDFRNILRQVLQNRGYQLSMAEDGTEAIREIEDHPPDLVLLDVMMPGKSGFDVCEWIRNDPRARHTFIILVTASGDQVSRERGLRLGADDYLTKPINPFEMITRVQKFLPLPIAI